VRFERFRRIADAQTDELRIGVRSRVCFTSACNFGKKVACGEIGKTSVSFYHKRILANRAKQCNKTQNGKSYAWSTAEMQRRRSDTDIGKKNAGQTASWTMRAKEVILIAMTKIPMKNAVAELDGDEMTRVLWQLVKDKLLTPYVDLKTEYYDLSLTRRDETDDKITYNAAEAIKMAKKAAIELAKQHKLREEQDILGTKKRIQENLRRK